MRIALDIRIAQFRDYQRRGHGYFTKNLVRNLIIADKKNQYLIIGYKGIQSFIDNIDYTNTQTYEIFSKIKPDLYNRFYKNLQFIEKRYLKKILKDNKIDIFVTFSSGNEGFQIDTLKTCKTIKVFLDLIPLIYKGIYLRKKGEYNKYLKSLKTFEQSSGIITISENSKMDLLKYINYNKEKIFVIYPGVAKRFVPVDRQDKICKIKNKYLIKDKYLLYVGGFDHRKNIENLIRAFSGLPYSILNNYQLVLCGNTYETIKCNLHRLAKNLGVSKNVIITNYVLDFELPILYSGAAALVFPSLYEGFGLPIIEAMACGCPVITSNTSALKEIAINAALLINPNNSEEIKLAVEKLTNNNSLRVNLIKKGVMRAKKFSWQFAAEKMIEIFNHYKHENMF